MCSFTSRNIKISSFLPAISGLNFFNRIRAHHSWNRFKIDICRYSKKVAAYKEHTVAEAESIWKSRTGSFEAVQLLASTSFFFLFIRLSKPLEFRKVQSKRRSVIYDSFRPIGINSLYEDFEVKMIENEKHSHAIMDIWIILYYLRRSLNVFHLLLSSLIGSSYTP